MNDNPIVEEVHRIREQLLAQHNGDLHSLVQHLKSRDYESARSGGRVITPPSRVPDGLAENALDESKKVG